MEAISESLWLSFEGGSFDKHRMEAQQLAEVIKDVHKLLEIINEEIYDNCLDLTLFVEAVEPGSLIELFKIEGKVVKELNKLLKDNPSIKVTGCMALILWIVLNGALKPEQLKQYQSIGDDIYAKHEQTALKQRTQKHINKLTKPFSNNLTDSSRLIINGEGIEAVTVDSEKISQAIASLPDETEKDQEWIEKHPRALISIVKPDLKGGKIWNVAFKDNEGDEHSVSVTIEDLNFLAYMATESVSVSRDHTLYADIEERLTKKAGKERSSRKWFITKVYNLKDRTDMGNLYESPEAMEI